MRIEVHRKVPRNSRLRKKLSRYLWKTPVGWISMFLNVGAPLYEATLADVGSAKTIFRLRSGRRQSVRECADSWLFRDSKRGSVESRKKLRKYTAMLKRGDELEVIVTLVRSRRGYTIADGNHRAISCYRAGLYAIPVNIVDIRWPA